jgi:hypothetical protein
MPKYITLYGIIGTELWGRYQHMPKKKILSIKSIGPLGGIRPGIGRDRDLRSNREWFLKVNQNLLKDAHDIISDGASFTINMNEQIIAPLSSLLDEVKKIPKCGYQYEIYRNFRLLVFSIKRTCLRNNVKSSPDLETFLSEINAIIGELPQLNDTVPLPPPKYLPVEFEKSCEKWSQLAWTAPSRSSKPEALYFFSRQERSSRSCSVRAHLLEIDQAEPERIMPQPTASSSSSHQKPNEQEALSYGQADFFEAGDLQADHCMPSKAIVDRQQELISAMNLDPQFGQQLFDDNVTNGYFLKHDEKYVGTKKFYLTYHNCVANTWLMNTKIGSEKSDSDPLDWLRDNPYYGKPFLQYVEENHGGIDTSKIVYTTKNGEFLAQVAKHWFVARHFNLIFVNDQIDHGVAPYAQNIAMHLDSSTSSIISSNNKSTSVDLLLTLAQMKRSCKNLAKQIGLPVSDSSENESNLEISSIRSNELPSWSDVSETETRLSRANVAKATKILKLSEATQKEQQDNAKKAYFERNKRCYSASENENSVISGGNKNEQTQIKKYRR